MSEPLSPLSFGLVALDQRRSTARKMQRKGRVEQPKRPALHFSTSPTLKRVPKGKNSVYMERFLLFSFLQFQMIMSAFFPLFFNKNTNSLVWLYL